MINNSTTSDDQLFKLESNRLPQNIHEWLAKNLPRPNLDSEPANTLQSNVSEFDNGEIDTESPIEDLDVCQENGEDPDEDKTRDSDSPSSVLKFFPFGLDQNMVCPLCKKCFRFEKNLLRHMQNAHATGTGESVLKCKLCNYTTRHYSNMYVHIRTHTGDKPYSCSACGAAFTQGSSLKLHIKSRHDDNFQFFSLTRKPGKNNLTKLWTRVLKKDLPKLNGTTISSIVFSAISSGFKPQTPTPVNPFQFQPQMDKSLLVANSVGMSFSPRKRSYTRRIRPEGHATCSKTKSPQKRIRISEQINGLVENRVGSLINNNMMKLDDHNSNLSHAASSFPKSDLTSSFCAIPSPLVMLERIRNREKVSQISPVKYSLPSPSVNSFDPQIFARLMQRMIQYSATDQSKMESHHHHKMELH